MQVAARPTHAGRSAGGARPARGVRHPRAFRPAPSARSEGRQARLPAYVDSAYFLLYNRTLQGILEATGAVTGRPRVAQRPPGWQPLPGGAREKLAGRDPEPAAVQSDRRLWQLYRAGGFRADPAADAADGRRRRSAASPSSRAARRSPPPRRRCGRDRPGLAHLLLALPGFALYLVVLPRIYGFSATDRVLDLLVLAIPFILSVSFLGQFVGSWFKRRETAVLLFIAISLPLFFLVGVAWPLEAIPPILRAASFVLPSTSGIDGLVRINQMGATLGRRVAGLDAAVDAGRRLRAPRHRSRPDRPRGGRPMDAGLGNVCSRRWP